MPIFTIGLSVAVGVGSFIAAMGPIGTCCMPSFYVEDDL